MHEVFVPAMGMAPDEVTLVSWLKSPGDAVAAGEAVAIVETSKANLEIESGAAGVLGHHLVRELDPVAPGSTITYVLGPDETEPESEAEGPDVIPIEPRDRPEHHDPTAAEGVAEPAQLAPEPITPESTAPELTAPRHTQSPRQRRMAAEGAAEVVANPPSSSSQSRDTVGSGELSGPAPDSVTQHGDDRHARYRAAISASVTRSWQEIPHFSVTRELRITELVTAIEGWRVVLPGLTLTDLMIRALALSFVDRERNSELDVGLAVATERGVAIPVIGNVLGLGLVELTDARRAAVERARAGQLHPDDGRVPVTTLSNLGAVGVDQFTGVVPYGQTNLVTVGRAAPRPVVDAGELAVATTMQVTLNVDHRSWDGLHAGQFLDRFARIMCLPDVVLGATRPAPQTATELAR